MGVNLIKYGLRDHTAPMKIPVKILEQMTEFELEELDSAPDWSKDGAIDPETRKAIKAAQKLVAGKMEDSKGSKQLGEKKGKEPDEKVTRLGEEKQIEDVAKREVPGDAKGAEARRAGIQKGIDDKAPVDLSKKRGPQREVAKFGMEKPKEVSAYSSGKQSFASGYGQAELKLATASINAGGSVMLGPKMLTVKGEVEGKAALLDGAIKLKTPSWDFDLFGEKLGAQMGVEGNVLVGATAKVGGAVDIKTTKAQAGLSASAEAFAGAKAGGKIFAALSWYKKAAATYTDGFVAWLSDKAKAQGTTGKIIAFVAENARDYLVPAVNWLLGDEAGKVDILNVMAGGEVSAGIGGTAKIGCNIGKSFRWTGALKGTLGVGVGGTLDVELGYVNGIALALIMAHRAWSSIAGAWPKMKAAIGERMEAFKLNLIKKLQGARDKLGELAWYQLVNKTKRAAMDEAIDVLTGANFATLLG